MPGALLPSHFSLHFSIRPNVIAFPKYQTTTSDHEKARSSICLDANENSAAPDQVGLGSGASDVIEVIIRMTCTPGQDKILLSPPTFDLYKVCATLQGVEVEECMQDIAQDGTFRIPVEQICTALSEDDRIKVLLLASPGNPTGTLIPVDQIQRILDLEELAFKGIVVIDEAYIDFAPMAKEASAVQLLPRYNNLIVVQSLSKSHGLAGIRVGMAIAHPAIIELFSKVQMPYKLSSVVLDLAERALSTEGQACAIALQHQVMTQRECLVKMLADPLLASNGIGATIGGQAANFVLIPILVGEERDDMRARQLTQQLRDRHGISIRYVGAQAGCRGCVRITVGTKDETDALRKALHTLLLE
ncbi:hypothetical protein GT037_009192 [Alternaria burnsii]|uniref:histidinol-phosphate transaminase n=1 Tax=Alternaria burnsii TaxID=1187904 RepID=A0A8H7EC91_9PLEO|nr:uncharacterized protein GT037_009192 [Alternaria burnsii]KAF7672691.1 hypothetical protein GT037_009192 [Alternaria burnsii]